MNMKEFLEEYGYRTLTFMVETLIEQAPPFKGDETLAAELGGILADLESALRSLPH